MSLIRLLNIEINSISSIKIIDENDSPPIIEMVSSVEITEYHDPKEVITTIKTKDADDPNTPNGKTKIIISSEIGNGMKALEP